MSGASDSPQGAAERPWSLRGDLLATHVLLWVVGAGRIGQPTPEVHLYLYDRYWRLAEYHARCGNTTRASRLKAKALAYFARSGCTGPPYAAAMAMPRPRPPIFTRAVAKDRLPKR